MWSYLSRAFFRPEVDVDLHASNLTLFLEENRNHVWSDLSRLVDAVFKNGQLFTQSIFQTMKLM